MPQVVAKANYIRMSPRKVRLVADAIRGRKAEDAQNYLQVSPKRASRVLLKLLKSALANADFMNKEKDWGMDMDQLVIKRVTVDEGPTLKRFRPRAMGRATQVNRRTSKITIVLDMKE